MPKRVRVRQGDSIVRIADAHGFYPGTIWDHPDNSELRERREHMNVLSPGDEVVIPERKAKTVSAATDRRHVFRRRGVPALFRLQLMKNGKARAREPFVLTVDGTILEGHTDGEGKIEVHVPTHAASGTLRLGDDPREIPIRFGHLDPSSELTGVQKRLANLGLYRGPIDGELTRATTAAILEFQLRFELEATGELDDATRRKLRDAHDAINHAPGLEKP